MTKQEAREAIVIKAIDRLRAVKNIPIKLHHFSSNNFNNECWDIEIANISSNSFFATAVHDDIFTARIGSVDQNEPPTMSFEKVVILRIAKLIYEEYKGRCKDDNRTINITNTNVSSIGNTLNIPDSTIISGSSISVWRNRVDDLEDKIKKLEQALQDANDKIDQFKAMQDILFRGCVDKKII